MYIHHSVNAINLFALIILAVTANAIFTKNDAVDLMGDYVDYEITTRTTRSMFECATICYGLDDCRAFLMNSITGK